MSALGRLRPVQDAKKSHTGAQSCSDRETKNKGLTKRKSFFIIYFELTILLLHAIHKVSVLAIDFTCNHIMHVGFKAREFFVEIAHKVQIIPSDLR
jgi:hypothetical protein